MGYLGLTPTTAQQNYLNIDDISGSFDGSTTSFALQVGSVAPTPFPVTNSCLISVGGVIQEPDDTGTSGFRISGGNIVFSSAPGTGEDFFGLILAGADYLNVGANFPDGTVGTPSITFDSDTNTGIYHPSADELSFVTGGSDRVRVDSNGRVGIGLVSPESPLHVETSGETIVTIEGNNTSAGAGGVLVLKNNDTSANNLNQIQGADAGGQTCSAISFTNVDQANNEGELRFLTRPSGGVPTERFRFGSAGQLGIGGATYGTSGQALLSQGSSSPPQWGDVSADGAFRSAQVFTTSGTWTKPAGLKRVRVFVTGGGGGGGVPATNTNNGGGGAAGGTAIEIIEAASLGSTETVTVGSGGSAGNPGGTGGTSSFGSHCSATGGTGASSDSTNTGAYVSGGVGSGGNLNLQGQGGEHGNPANTAGVGGTGGNSYWGGGGHGGTNYDRPHAGAGANGGGGGGGYRTTAGASGSGGNGGAGIVYVEQYF